MNTITVSTDVFTFDELSDAAKEVARSWYRDGALEYEWYDCVIEGAKEIGKLMGIQIDRIFFSGFSSQGDGACFEGSYSYAKGSLAAIKGYAPLDTRLHEIAKDLQQIQRRHFYKLSASVKQSGHYMHDQCTEIDVRKDTGSGDDYFFDTDDSYVRGSTHDGAELVRVLRSFMQWIYRSLETEYDYLMSDEQVDESIRINEYTFTEDGERF